MTKSITQNALDTALEYIASRGNKLTLCTGVPINFAQANTLKSVGGRVLASVALEPGTDGADFTLDDGTTSGRRLIVAAQNALLIEESGRVDHIAIVDTTASELLTVTPAIDPQTYLAGTLMLLKSFSQELSEPQ